MRKQTLEGGGREGGVRGCGCGGRGMAGVLDPKTSSQLVRPRNTASFGYSNEICQQNSPSNKIKTGLNARTSVHTAKIASNSNNSRRNSRSTTTTTTSRKQHGGPSTSSPPKIKNHRTRAPAITLIYLVRIFACMESSSNNTDDAAQRITLRLHTASASLRAANKSGGGAGAGVRRQCNASYVSSIIALRSSGSFPHIPRTSEYFLARKTSTQNVDRARATRDRINPLKSREREPSRTRPARKNTTGKTQNTRRP